MTFGSPCGVGREARPADSDVQVVGWHVTKLWAPVRADGKRECPVCGLSFRDAAKRGFAVVAHFDYSVRPRRWCPGGAPPRPGQARNRVLPVPGGHI